MLGVTMRMVRKEYKDGRFELRDAIACDWQIFLELAPAATPYVLLPNLGESITAYARQLGITRIIFTGGDDWGVFPQRDLTEKQLFLWGREHDLPIFGVCRGAQIINMLMGGKLQKCAGHVASSHAVMIQGSACGANRHIVNSYHALCIPEDGLAPGLEAFAKSQDGGIEGFKDRHGKIFGVMWHPERARIPACLDLNLFAEFANSQACSEQK